MLSYGSLKEAHRNLRDGFDESFSIRVHRALSWLERAEKESSDADAGFIFYWISFNSNYSIELDDRLRLSETKRFQDYFKLIVESDDNNQIYNLVWERFPQEIRGILNNEFIFQAFWQVPDAQSNWKDAMEESKNIIGKALKNKNTVVILQILFSRLYVLRNQLIHGNATWNGQLNRQQVNDGYRLLGALQPVFLSIMMSNPHKEWGRLAYPIINLE